MEKEPKNDVVPDPREQFDEVIAYVHGHAHYRALSDDEKMREAMRVLLDDALPTAGWFVVRDNQAVRDGVLCDLVHVTDSTWSRDLVTDIGGYTMRFWLRPAGSDTPETTR